jgi:hypothetical protein
MKKVSLIVLASSVVLLFGLGKIDPSKDARLKGAFRRAETNGWIQVRLQGSPSQIGFQHGYLLAPEIKDAFKILKLELTRDSKKDWMFFRNAAQEVMWPRIDAEYREELQGIADGAKAHGVEIDVVDVTAMNAWLELSPYYTSWFDKNQGKPPEGVTAPAERCSAFVATGSYTRDGKPVIGHNAWTNYMDGERWNIVFDITPLKGNGILMDGFPGLIHSADDFGVNTAGIMITETTISEFSGFDPKGVPEFVRARKAMQYSSSIDDFARIMQDGNNGGYANTWLVADRKTGEIASLELGLKNVTLQRTKDGYFSGSNYPANEKLIKEETDFNPADLSTSANARRVRWDQLMAENKGRIDVEAGKRFLADHYDSYQKKVEPNERTLCGHIDLSPRGLSRWQQPYGIAGAVQSKVMDAGMAERMTFWGAMGHSCGIHFKAAAHLKAHPDFDWQKEYLKDMNSRPWTMFAAAR